MESVSASEKYRRVRSLSQQEPSPTRVVDWSYQQLKTLDGLQCLADSQHLILDGNLLERLQLPFMPFLMTLSLNDNKITDLDLLCYNLRTSCPSLTHLSLIGNPACPHPIIGGGTDKEYMLCRRFILSKLPRLKFLDSTTAQQARRHRIQSEANYASSGCRDGTVKRAVFSILHRFGFPDHHDTIDGVEDTNNNQHEARYKKKVSKIERPYRGTHSEGNRFIRDHQL